MKPTGQLFLSFLKKKSWPIACVWKFKQIKKALPQLRLEALGIIQKAVQSSHKAASSKSLFFSSINIPVAGTKIYHSPSMQDSTHSYCFFPACRLALGLHGKFSWAAVGVIPKEWAMLSHVTQTKFNSIGQGWKRAVLKHPHLHKGKSKVSNCSFFQQCDKTPFSNSQTVSNSKYPSRTLLNTILDLKRVVEG